MPGNPFIWRGRASDPKSHDWWSYQIITGAGGVVLYDPRPTVRYRQHGKNLVGGNAGPRAALGRLRMLLKGQFKEWNGRNEEALRHNEEFLTPENREILNAFSEIRGGVGFLKALRLVKRHRLQRISRAQRLVFYLLIFLGKF